MTVSAERRKIITDRILSEIKGRMLEDIILLETSLGRKNQRVFKLVFAVGEFDMVVQDTDRLSCEIFKIKLSSSLHPAQYRHLVDNEKCAETAYRFGAITKKTVLYNGESVTEGEIEYKNISEYLKAL